MKSTFSSVLLAVLSVALAPSTVADVLVVNIWDPMPGKGAATVQNSLEARKIHESMGAQALVAADQMGRVHYGLTFDDWAAWAAFGEKLEASKEWQTFWSRVSQSPSAELQDQYMLEQPSPGAPGKVYQVFIWDAHPGRTADTIERAMGAKAIHEKGGAGVGINVDPFGRVHYVMSFDSWSDWGKFQDAPNDEFQAYMAQISGDPSAELVRIYTAEQL